MIFTERKILVGAKIVLSKELNLIKLESAKRVIFVGDTHGDLEASEKVVKEHLKPGNKIVFLGDYADRGPFSRENLEFLLKTKIKYPKQIYLLQGNHEGHRILKFSPADFWQSLSEKEYNTFSTTVEKMSLTVVTKDIIALHGALPDVKNLENINKIKLGDEQWFKITWGDFIESPGKALGINFLTGRPQFGKDYFFETMERFKKKILIRSHQPDSPQFMFNDKCLTIFTSSAYPRERTIAIADLKKEIKTAQDLKIIRI